MLRGDGEEDAGGERLESGDGFGFDERVVAQVDELQRGVLVWS